jgi:hypothetical protein
METLRLTHLGHSWTGDYLDAVRRRRSQIVGGPVNLQGDDVATLRRR